MSRTWLGGPAAGPDRVRRSTDAAEVLHVDCDRCTVRGAACSECVVSVLLGPPGGLALDDGERAALAALAGGGLVPPLRLVTAVAAPTDVGLDEHDDAGLVHDDAGLVQTDDGWGDGTTENWG